MTSTPKVSSRNRSAISAKTPVHAPLTTSHNVNQPDLHFMTPRHPEPLTPAALKIKAVTTPEAKSRHLVKGPRALKRDGDLSAVPPVPAVPSGLRTGMTPSVSEGSMDAWMRNESAHTSAAVDIGVPEEGETETVMVTVR